MFKCSVQEGRFFWNQFWLFQFLIRRIGKWDLVRAGSGSGHDPVLLKPDGEAYGTTLIDLAPSSVDHLRTTCRGDRLFRIACPCLSSADR